MKTSRTTVIYGNCGVYSPEGELMFRCREKKARWYLTRNLAAIMSHDPLNIQLNFKPKGHGERPEVLKIERENRCVVCGNAELEVLTRHHMVPFEYRKFFPESRKQHSSLFVVSICRKCHSEYEAKHALILKEAYALRYKAPLLQADSPAKSAEILVNTILNHCHEIPAEKLKKLQGKCFKSLKELGLIKYDGEVTAESLKRIREHLRSNKSDKWKHGYLVVKSCSNLDELEREWINNFFDTMKPKFAPAHMLEAFDHVLKLTL